MTTLVQHRCFHCNVRYTYQGSGHGCLDPLNDAHWCRDCKQVIIEALSNVPQRVEKDYETTNEVSAFDLETLEKERWEATEAKGGIPVRRVAAPLFDLKDPSNRQIAGITGLDGKTYRWSYWTKDPKGTAEVLLIIERDLATGKTRPWVNL